MADHPRCGLERFLCEGPPKKFHSLVDSVSLLIFAGSEQTMTALDESLLSLEKLDRTSPELWPEQIPGVSDYMHLNALSTHPLPKLWNKPLDQDDYNLMIQLGNLSHGALIAEVKKLHDAAYKLGLEEAKEMTKGKYLNVLSKKKYHLN